jgi:glycosyltransferase involved in cell wall biosynthesis
MKVSIIIPAYNEEKRIGKTLKEYSRFFKELKEQGKIDFEILVVINNTKDKTEEVVKSLSKENKEIKYFNFPLIKGKGFAIIEGFKDAIKENNEIIGFVDADGSTSPEALYYLIVNLKDYDGVIANRYLKGSKIKKQPFQRVIASRVFNFLVKILFLFPYSDTQCGAKIFKKKVIENIINDLGETKWAFDIDLLYRIRKKGFKIIEAPTVWIDDERSVLNLKKDSIQMFFAIIRLRIVNSPFKRLLKPLESIETIIFNLIK